MPNPDKGILMKRVFFLTPFALATASCAPAPSQIEAGQWQVVSELQSVAFPGATPEDMDRARDSIGRPSTSRRCFTDEQARDFMGQIVKRSIPPTCTFSEEKYGEGEISLRVACPGQGGQPTIRLSFDGRFSRTTFNVRVNVERPNASAPTGAPIRTTEILRGRRVGVCPAEPAVPAMPSQL